MTLGAGLVVNGRYKILSKLGEGGFASVYLAEDLELGRQSAVKFLHSDTLADDEDLLRFQREARLLGRLVHPNIVSAYAFGYTELSSDSEGKGATPFIVMELLEGESLAGLLRTVGSLGADACINIFSQIAAGLQFAHNAGVIHRDLNTGNIFLIREDDKFRVKLIDFGISHLRSESSSTNKLTKTGFLIGTPQYMSPELAAGQKATVSSDIYSFGCVLYECLSGKLPLDADNAIGVLFKQRNEYPNKIELDWSDQKMASSLKQLTLRCLQKKPEKRYQSCEQIERDFTDIAQGAEISVPGDLHPWADAGIEKTKKAVPLKFAFGVLSILFAIIVLVSSRVALVEVLYQPFVSMNFPAATKARASYFDLLQSMRSARAASFAEEIAEQYGARSEFLSERNWLLRAADAHYGKKNLDSAMECLNRAIKANGKISGKAQRMELYKSAVRLVDLYQKETASWPEIDARSQLVLQTSRDNYSSGMPRAYNEFVSRADHYVGFSNDSEDLMDALLVPLEKRQVIVYPDLEAKLSNIVGFLPFVEKYVHGELRNLRFVSAVLRNKGLTPQYRGTMELAKVQLESEGAPQLEADRLVDLASKRGFYSDLFKFSLNLRLAELYLRLSEFDKARQSTLVAGEFGKVLNIDKTPLLLEYLIRSKATGTLNEFVHDTIDRLEMALHVHKSERSTEQFIYDRMASPAATAFNEQQSILRKMRSTASAFHAPEIEMEITNTLARWQEKYHLSSVASPAITFPSNGHLSSLSRNFFSMCVEGDLEQAEKILSKEATESKGADRAALLQICLYTSNILTTMERHHEAYRVLCFGLKILDPSIPFRIDSLSEFIAKYCSINRSQKIFVPKSEWKRIADVLVESISAPGVKFSDQAKLRVLQSTLYLADAAVWSSHFDEALKFLLEFKKAATNAKIFDAYSIYYDRALSETMSAKSSDISAYRNELENASENFVEFARHPVSSACVSDAFLRDTACDLYICCKRVGLDNESEKVDTEWRRYLEERNKGDSQLWKRYLFNRARLASSLDGQNLLNFGSSYLKIIEPQMPTFESTQVLSVCLIPGRCMIEKGFNQEAANYLLKIKALLRHENQFTPAVALIWYDCFLSSKEGEITSEKELIDNFKELFDIVDASGQNRLKAEARVVLALHLYVLGFKKESRRFFLDAFDKFKTVAPEDESYFAFQCYLRLAALEPKPNKSLRYLHDGLAIMVGKDHGTGELIAYKEQLILTLKAAGLNERARTLAQTDSLDIGLMLLFSQQ